MSWSPYQYLKFATERFEPFNDLIALIDQDIIGRAKDIIDLGCGTGELTQKLSEILPGAKILGIDNSPEMLEKARLNTNSSVSFELRAIEDIAGEWDLIFSNAAIHWVENHPDLLAKLWAHLKSGGQIVVQVPSGVRNRAQLAVMETGAQSPYLNLMNGWTWKFPVLPVDEYAEILFHLGAKNIAAFEKVFPHVLADGEAVFEWVAGTTMTAFTSRLSLTDQGIIEDFNARVKAKILEAYPGSPVIFPFRRIFFAGMKE